MINPTEVQKKSRAQQIAMLMDAAKNKSMPLEFEQMTLTDKAKNVIAAVNKESTKRQYLVEHLQTQRGFYGTTLTKALEMRNKEGLSDALMAPGSEDALTMSAQQCRGFIAQVHQDLKELDLM